jgi:hypothetical protein
MAIHRNIKQAHSDGYIAEHLQSLTGKDTGTPLLGFGVSAITIASGTESGSADFVFRLASPVCPGIFKTVVVAGASASDKTISVRTAATAQVFFGSTFNAISYTTTINNPSDALLLVGVSTSQWAVLNRSLSSAAALTGLGA